jgi:predicted AAA+ superfamily ATPase
MFARWYEAAFAAKLTKPYVHLMFGARQTGKSTLIRKLLPARRLEIDLSDPSLRSRYLVEPERLIQECQKLPKQRGGFYVFVDEAQSVPAIFDAVQHLYDGDKQRWRFVICGSSARKLRTPGANLLPGRSFLHRLFPLTLTERPPLPKPSVPVESPLHFPWRKNAAPGNPFASADLETRLAFGELPGIAVAPEEDREELLRAYAIAHLEEEIRREAMVKDWAAFVRFLRLAAAESGQILNYAAISRETGLSQPTVKSHYQLLDDMFIGFSITAWSGSSRKHLLSTPRFLLFDLGLRHAAAGLTPSRDVVRANPGPLFEQWVGIELWKRLQYLGTGTLHYLRTKDGAEVDFIIAHHGKLTPVEVKWTQNPSLSDARHLLGFLREHPKTAQHGYLICRCPLPRQLHDKVTALPWFCL